MIRRSGWCSGLRWHWRMCREASLRTSATQTAICNSDRELQLRPRSATQTAICNSDRDLQLRPRSATQTANTVFDRKVYRLRRLEQIASRFISIANIIGNEIAFNIRPCVLMIAFQQGTLLPAKYYRYIIPFQLEVRYQQRCIQN